MIRQIVKSGNSTALILSKDMRDHLGLQDNNIEVIFEKDSLVLRKPNKGQSFEDAMKATLEEYDTAFRNLAK